MSYAHIAAGIYAAKYGLSVIPIDPTSKLPACKWKEYQERRATPLEIASWPDPCNVAVVTGAVSGIVVIDCESRAAAERVYRYTRHHGDPAIVQSKRGFHFWWKHPGEHVTPGANFHDGLYDIRGDRSYALLPPSKHANGEYKWIRGPLPVDSLPLFQPEWRPDNGKSANERSITDGTAYISKIVAVSGENGHGDTYRAACTLREAGYTEVDAFAALLEWNKSNAQGPWTPQELLHKIRGAYGQQA